MGKQLGAPASQGAQATSVAHPEKRRASFGEESKLNGPQNPDTRRMAGREAVTMEINVPSLIAENQPAHIGQRLISHMTAQDAVVSGADDLHDQEHEHFELHTQSPANGVEQLEAEGAGDKLASNPTHGAFQEAGMFALLGKPKIRHHPHFLGRCPKSFRVLRDQPALAAAIAELIFRDGSREEPAPGFAHDEGRRPVGLRPVKTIGLKMLDPMLIVHKRVGV
jgi:hypothetical protein